MLCPVSGAASSATASTYSKSEHIITFDKDVPFQKFSQMKSRNKAFPCPIWRTQLVDPTAFSIPISIASFLCLQQIYRIHLDLAMQCFYLFYCTRNIHVLLLTTICLHSREPQKQIIKIMGVYVTAAPPV